MPAVAEGGAGIKHRETRPYVELRKGYTAFRENDVLFAKITPCMQNAKHAIAHGLIDGIGFGSTEFHVLRPQAEVTSEWIHYFLLQPSLLLDATRYFTGAVGQQRVPEDYLATLEIPLPPVAEQRRIAARLREQLSILAEARAALEVQLEAADALPAAHLRNVFESEEAKRWPRMPLSELCEIVATQVDPRVDDFIDLPHVNGENIESGTLQLFDVRTAREDRMISGKYLFEKDDVLYSKLRPYLRKVAVAPSRGLCSADMYPLRVRSDRLNARYIAWVLLSEEFTKYAIGQSQRSRMPKLNREQLFAWEVPFPVIDHQVAIAARLDDEFDAAREMRQSIQEKLDDVEELPAALLREAFSANGA